MGFAMNTLLTRAGPVAYAEQGSGPPLIMLHANGHEHRDFDSVVEVLSQKYHTIAVDWPGFGASPAPQPPRTASASGLADMLEAIVAARALEPAVFLGHSVGGFAAARLAITHPQWVRGLILIAPGGFIGHTWFTRLFCRIKGSEAVTRVAESLFARRYLKRHGPFVAAMLDRIAIGQRNPPSVAINAAVWRSFADPNHDLRADGADRCANADHPWKIRLCHPAAPNRADAPHYATKPDRGDGNRSCSVCRRFTDVSRDCRAISSAGCIR